MESKARLEFPRGMNLHALTAREFEDQGHWYRIEAYEVSPGGKIEAMAYRRMGSYWKKYWSQRTAMEKRFLLESIL